MIGDTLPKFVRDWLWKNAWKFPNVIGFSTDVLPRFRHNAFEFSRETVKFYVQKKFPLDMLRAKDIIPEELKLRHYFKKYSFDTDVMEIGLPKAPMPIPNVSSLSEVDKTVNFRPVEMGVSVGNEKITAGSLGMLYERTKTEPIKIPLLYPEFHHPYNVVTTKDIVAGSNAHVTTPNAGWSVEDVINSGAVRILQRGAYHGGKVPDDVVGEYQCHQQIYPMNTLSNCKISKSCTFLLNGLSSILRRQTRFKPYIEHVNSIDFGFYKPSVEHIMKIADNSIDITKPFCGHLYAGSDQTGIICKISEILKAFPNLKPMTNQWRDPRVGERVKGCSFWCNYETLVTDVNGVITVNYGDFLALMQNAVVVQNDGTIKGGYSGSGWWIS